MLALVVAVALSQCTKDTDCKGYRICKLGECVDPADAPVMDRSSEAPHESVFATAERKPAANPFRVHRYIGMGLSIGTWGATVVGTIALAASTGGLSGYGVLAMIPVVGPLVSYLSVQLSPDVQWNGATGPVLLWISTVLQFGSLSYLLASAIKEANFDPGAVTIGPGPGLAGLALAVRI